MTGTVLCYSTSRQRKKKCSKLNTLQEFHIEWATMIPGQLHSGCPMPCWRKAQRLSVPCFGSQLKITNIHRELSNLQSMWTILISAYQIFIANLRKKKLEYHLTNEETEAHRACSVNDSSFLFFPLQSEDLSFSYVSISYNLKCTKQVFENFDLLFTVNRLMELLLFLTYEVEIKVQRQR